MEIKRDGEPEGDVGLKSELRLRMPVRNALELTELRALMTLKT